MDRLGSLGAFIQAAEHRSFTTAGRHMGLSSSAVGKAVSRLEHRLGVRLFYRSTRQITLTPEGGLFLKRCTRVLDEIEEAEAELALVSSAPRGRLRVALPMTGCLLMPAITAFIGAYPEIELELEFTERAVDMIEEGLDIMVRTSVDADSRLITRTLGSYRHVIVGSPAYLHEAGTPQVPSDLSEHACLRQRVAATGKLGHWPLLACAGPDAAYAMPTAAISNAVGPLISMAEAGLGLLCVPDFTIRAQLDQRSLIPVLQGHLRQESTIRMLWPTRRHAAPKIGAFVDFMARHLFRDGTDTKQRPALHIVGDRP